MSVPNVPFYLSQAAAEFKVAVPTTASQILTAVSLPTEGLLSRLAGKSFSSHSMACGSYSSDVVTTGFKAAGFRTALDQHDQPQSPFGVITPAVFNGGEIRTLVSSTNSPNRIAFAAMGFVPVGTRVQISVYGLGSNVKTVLRGGDRSFMCLFDLAGAFNLFSQAGAVVSVDLKIV